jgi:hypothetical protein
MLRDAIVRSGMALLRTGVEMLVSAGSEYLLDPKLGEQRRRRIWKGAHVALDRAESMTGAVLHGVQKEARNLRGLARHAAHWRPRRRRSLALPLALTGIGVTLGAGLMFFLDPRHGADRRALLGERLNRACDAAARIRV